MPRGPQGQRRPADVIGAAVMVARIATGEIEEPLREPSGKVRSGKAGAAARAEKLTQEERTAIAKNAAARRWGLTMSARRKATAFDMQSIAGKDRRIDPLPRSRGEGARDFNHAIRYRKVSVPGRPFAPQQVWPADYL